MLLRVKTEGEMGQTQELKLRFHAGNPLGKHQDLKTGARYELHLLSPQNRERAGPGAWISSPSLCDDTIHHRKAIPRPPEPSAPLCTEAWCQQPAPGPGCAPSHVFHDLMHLIGAISGGVTSLLRADAALANAATAPQWELPTKGVLYRFQNWFSNADPFLFLSF